MVGFIFPLKAQNYFSLEGGGKLSLSQQHQPFLDPIRWRLAPDYEVGLYVGRKFKNQFILELGASYSSSTVNYHVGDGSFNLRFPFKVSTNVVQYGMNVKMPVLIREKYQLYSLFGVAFNIIYTDNYGIATIDAERYGTDISSDITEPALDYKLVFTEAYNTIEQQNLGFKAGVNFNRKITDRCYLTSNIGFHVGMSNLLSRGMTGDYYTVPDNKRLGSMPRIFIFNKGDYLFLNIGVQYFIKKNINNEKI